MQYRTYKPPRECPMRDIFFKYGKPFAISSISSARRIPPASMPSCVWKYCFALHSAALTKIPNIYMKQKIYIGHYGAQDRHK